MELLLLFGLGLQGFDAELQLAGVLLMLHKDTYKVESLQVIALQQVADEPSYCVLAAKKICRNTSYRLWSRAQNSRIRKQSDLYGKNNTV